MRTGTEVENQMDPPNLRGTVITSSVPGLDGWVLVEWDDGQVLEELESDVTEVTT